MVISYTFMYIYKKCCCLNFKLYIFFKICDHQACSQKVNQINQLSEQNKAKL